MERSPELEKEETLAYLERESAIYVGIRARAERAGGMNGELNRLRAESMARLDHLLDDLFAQSVCLEPLPIAE